MAFIKDCISFINSSQNSYHQLRTKMAEILSTQTGGGSAENNASRFDSAKNDVTTSRSNFLYVCDPVFVKKGTEEGFVKGEQLRCYEIRTKIGLGGQAVTFRGKKDPKKVTKDTLMQQFVRQRAHDLAVEKNKGLGDLGSFIDRAEKEGEAIWEDRGKRGLRKALEEIIEKRREKLPDLRTPGDDVCIRITKTLNENQAMRMNRERAMSGMMHPNIVYVHNSGVICERGVFVSELVKGIVEPYSFSLDQLIGGIIHAAKGLHYLHQNGVFHRDVKPENILFKRPNGTNIKAKVIDYGLAKIVDFEKGSNRLTLSQELLGTPLYASPEQIESSKYADAQSDIYSLGATLYEILTWESPIPYNPNEGDVAIVMGIIKNLENKFYGRESLKPTRIMNVDRRITLRELFGLSLRDQKKKKNGNGKFLEIKRDDIETHNVRICNTFREAGLKLWRHKQYHNLMKKLEYLELITACMMHPGENDSTDQEGNLLHTRRYRYQTMDDVISDLESILEDEQPMIALELISKKYNDAKSRSRDQYIHEIFSDRSRYAKRTISDRLTSGISYSAKATAAVLGGLVFGGTAGYLLNHYLHIGDKVANFVSDIAGNLPN